MASMNLSSAFAQQQYPELVRTSLERYLADLAIKSPSLGAEAKVAVAQVQEALKLK